jgi:arsenite methyltransferase
MEQLLPVRDAILDEAEPLQGKVLLDVGCGDGLVAFGALERGARSVVFSDISQDLLDEARRLSAELEVGDRCCFVCSAADDLSPVDDESVDVVATRSVLIYVEDKQAAFREFHRVLRRGGRVSIFEPINRLGRFMRAYDAAGVEELDNRVKGVFEKLQPRDRDPMLNFDDRDLVDFAEIAGFNPIKLRLEVTSQPPEPMAWDAYLDTAWNPKIPTMREVIHDVLNAEERRRYTTHMRPLVEQGRGHRRMAAAYLIGTKLA